MKSKKNTTKKSQWWEIEKIGFDITLEKQEKKSSHKARKNAKLKNKKKTLKSSTTLYNIHLLHDIFYGKGIEKNRNKIK